MHTSGLSKGALKASLISLQLKLRFWKLQYKEDNNIASKYLMDSYRKQLIQVKRELKCF